MKSHLAERAMVCGEDFSTNIVLNTDLERRLKNSGVVRLTKVKRVESSAQVVVRL